MEENKERITRREDFPDFTKRIILSIVQLLCCCQITGIISLVFFILANNSYKAGIDEDYNAKCKIAKTSQIIGWILGIGVLMLALLYYVLMFILAAPGIFN